MQKASDKYIESMKLPFRNRSYIRGSIGIINSEAQKTAKFSDDTEFTAFSNGNDVFTKRAAKAIYATAEQDFSKVDGSMYFCPTSGAATYMASGVVTKDIKQAVKITFGGASFDIRGLTIDFGDNYPTKFNITCGSVNKDYSNTSSTFVTEDVFENVSEITITPKTMKYGENRFRIYALYFGVVKYFDNSNTLSCSITDVVSPISETLPSRDVSLSLDNQDDYFDAENIKSASGFLKVGQELKIEFGYDIDGNGNIEWLPEIVSYLDSWNSNDISVEFKATDYISSQSNKYYRGVYVRNGISLYELAVDVLEDAGISNDRYILDDYLKNVKVKNPIPVVRHTEALQIIANAGRCAIFEDRKGKINITPAFIPKKSISTNGETSYSKSYNILTNDKKDAYAIASYNFSSVDGTLLFLDPNDVKNTGYISREVSTGANEFILGNPIITFTSEAEFRAYNLYMQFRGISPEQFVIRTYLKGKLQETITKDLFEEKTRVYGKLKTTMFKKLDPSTGKFLSTNFSLAGTYYASDYIEITDDVISIRFQNDGTSYFNFCIYDADKNRLEGAGGVENTLFTPTEKSKYFAISYLVDSGRSDYPKITETYKAPFSGGSYKLEKDFGYIDKAEIEFTKGAKNARVAVDYLMIGDPTNYTIHRNDLSDYPECTLENRAHKVALVKTVYSETSEESKEIVSENVTITENNQVHEIYFSNASYGLSVTTNNTAIKAEIVEWGNFYVKVKFTGVTASADVTVTVSGKEYVVTQKTDIANTSEKYQEWENPLISEDSPELEKWIEDYYSSVIDYSLEWRGDPRVDANDAFYLEKKNGRTALIQVYENEIEFNGRFSGKIKARQVDM